MAPPAGLSPSRAIATALGRAAAALPPPPVAGAGDDPGEGAGSWRLLPLPPFPSPCLPPRTRLPVLRVFGATPGGKELCLYLLRVLPYFCVRLPERVALPVASACATVLRVALKAAATMAAATLAAERGGASAGSGTARVPSARPPTDGGGGGDSCGSSRHV